MMLVDLLVDGMMSGSGVRDAINGGYIKLPSLGLSANLVKDITSWQAKCAQCHIDGFPEEIVESLDQEGCKLTHRIRSELPTKSVGYYSDGLTRRLI